MLYLSSWGGAGLEKLMAAVMGDVMMACTLSGVGGSDPSRRHSISTPVCLFLQHNSKSYAHIHALGLHGKFELCIEL